MLSAERGLPLGLHKLIHSLKQDYTLRIGFANCKPCFSHEYALSRLKASGYKLASCSNSVRKTMEMFFELSALTKYFDFYISNEDVMRSKPDPEMYNQAMSRLGFKPEECLILEDNENGIKAATASGAHLLVVSGVHDVTFQNITKCIADIEAATSS